LVDEVRAESACVLKNFARADGLSGRLTPCAGNSAYASESELADAASSKSAAPCGVNKRGYAPMVTGFAVVRKRAIYRDTMYFAAARRVV